MRQISMFAAVAAAICVTIPAAFASGPSEISFELTPNPKFVDCLVKDKFAGPPRAKVTVTRGRLNDVMFLRLSNIKPGLQFDIFTVEKSQFLADGGVDPNFLNFGMAWYQSDLEAEANGTGDVTIKTILLDQIFGFDPAVNLPPTNTFHVGFWFNDPQAAAACGFDPTKPTPFNGEHKAGPLAMMSIPSAQTTLGPLCSNPEYTPTGVKCNP